MWLAVSVITSSWPTLSPLRPLALVLLLASPRVAGVVGARNGGRARDGALAGFWCGIVAAALIAVITIAVDNAFATTLIHTSWSDDPTCPQPPGVALAGCEIGDDLGLTAVELTLLPVVWFGLGAVSGSLSTAAATGSTDLNRPSSLRGAITFSVIMLALFLAEMALKLV
jgi:hypothetical protein